MFLPLHFSLMVSVEGIWFVGFLFGLNAEDVISRRGGVCTRARFNGGLMVLVV